MVNGTIGVRISEDLEGENRIECNIESWQGLGNTSLLSS